MKPRPNRNPHPLREIALVTNRRAESVAAAVLEAVTGITPGIHTDAETGIVTVSAFDHLSDARALELRRTLSEAIADMKAEGIEVGPGRARIRRVPARDWAESWKRHFKPVAVGRRLLVKPTWSRRKPAPGQALVLLDPGLSFGTGQHATTRFCLQQLVQLRDATRPQSMLDAGTGSGILALAAAALGYGPVDAFDFDPDCVRTSHENAALNALGHQVTFTQADVTKLPRKVVRRYDVVCANLIYDLLISQAPGLLARVAPGGHIVLAGILTSQFKQVRDAYAAHGWKCTRAFTEGEWRSGLFAKES